GGFIVANTAPGCWGPMITPELKGGHEVTRPVYVEGAEVGDAIAIHIKNIEVTSIASGSGNDVPVEGHFNGDPFVAAKCPGCGTVNPETVIKGIGEEAIRCVKCDTVITPFALTHAYSIAFNDDKSVGLTLNKQAAETVAKDGRTYMNTQEQSIQNSILKITLHHITRVIAILRTLIGQINT